MAGALEGKHNRRKARHDSALRVLALRHSAGIHCWFVFEHSERGHSGRSGCLSAFHEGTAVSVAGRGIEGHRGYKPSELAEESGAAGGSLSTIFWSGKLRCPRRSSARPEPQRSEGALSQRGLTNGFCRERPAARRNFFRPTHI